MPARLLWSGRPPAPAVVRRLAAAGIAVLPRASDEEGQAGVVAVVVAGDGRRLPPRGRGGRPWIWLVDALAPEALGAAVAAGAYDVVTAAVPPEALAARLVARVRELEAAVLEPPAAPGLVAESPAGRRLLSELALAARTSMPVLLTGETGTGKEVAARLLHAWSARRVRPFVPINCAAIPNELLESELFGHAKGAFSGAVREYDGQLAAAEGGTVFLDEVDDTPLSFQVKLLRVLEDRVVSRLGQNDWRKVDFRILAATNRDLRTLIARGLFGADLFERLAIVSIRLPPLRERREDLPALARHMIARYYDEEPAARARHEVTAVTPEALAALVAYPWPGNIRELRNVVFGALVRKRAGGELLVSDLPPRLLRPQAEPAPPAAVVSEEALALALEAGRFNLRATIEGLERVAVERALARSGGNAAAAASLLGEVGRGGARDPGATVRAMMRRLGIADPAGRSRA